MSARQVTVVAPSRLHFGMFSFGRSDVRQFGGAGVMIDAPVLRMTFRAANELEIVGPRSDRARVFAGRVGAALWPGRPSACRVEVITAPRPHVGLGSGTQLGLAVAAGLSAFVAVPPRAIEELAVAAGRGERSAIGLHGFARGGFLIEAGKGPGERVSPLVARIDLPAAWRFVLLCPREHVGLSGRAEREAFAQLPAVPVEVSAELERSAVERLAPAARAGRFAEFSDELYRFGHRAGLCFAARQGGAFASPLLSQVVEIVRALGVSGVGQSSWGPTLFALLADEYAARDFVAAIEPRLPGGPWEITIAPPNNTGSQIAMDD